MSFLKRSLVSKFEFFVPQLVNNKKLLLNKDYDMSIQNDYFVVHYKPKSKAQLWWLMFESEKEDNYSMATFDYTSKYVLRVYYKIPNSKKLLKSLVLSCDDTAWPSYVFTEAIEFWKGC